MLWSFLAVFSVTLSSLTCFVHVITCNTGLQVKVQSKYYAVTLPQWYGCLKRNNKVTLKTDKLCSFLPDADQVTVSDSDNVLRIAADDGTVDDNRLQQATQRDLTVSHELT